MVKSKPRKGHYGGLRSEIRARLLRRLPPQSFKVFLPPVEKNEKPIHFLSISGFKLKGNDRSRVKSIDTGYHTHIAHLSTVPRLFAQRSSQGIILMRDSAIDTEVSPKSPQPKPKIEPFALSLLRLHQHTPPPDVKDCRFREYAKQKARLSAAMRLERSCI